MKSNFYPRLIQIKTDDFGNLLESETVQGKAKKLRIDECDFVYDANGNQIDMKYLKFEMENAKLVIMNQSPLFAPYMRQFENPIYTWQVPTMATDGTRLFVNPAFGQKLTWDQKIFVIIHELMHCVLMHVERMGARTHTVTHTYKDENGKESQSAPSSLWNIAADYEINPILVDTVPEFTEQIVHDIHGLYDKKYLNMDAETIYLELLKNTPKMQPPLSDPQADDYKGKPDPNANGKGQPGQGGGGPQKITIEPGMKVRMKDSGAKGIIKSVKPDGTYEIEPLNERLATMSFYPRLLETMNVTGGIFQRDEFIPILPPNKAPKGGGGEGGNGGGQSGQGGGKGGGQGDPSNQGEEYEIEGQEGIPQHTPDLLPGEGERGNGGGQPGESNPGNLGSTKGIVDGQEVEIIDEVPRSRSQGDGGNAGTMISKQEGDKIAKAAGVEGSDKGGSKDQQQQALDSKWKEAAKKMLEDLERGAGSNSQGRGGGFSGGDFLKKLLSRLIRGEVDWKQELARFTGKALTPDKVARLGNKKYLHAGDLRYRYKNKKGAVQNIIVLVDASGSMSFIEENRILDEIGSIIFSKKAKEITLAFFDGDVDRKSVQKIKARNRPQIPDRVPSGGGTDFQAALNWVTEKYKDNVQLLIFITDGGAPIPRQPKYHRKFVWLVYDDPSFKHNVDWGKIIDLPRNKEKK